MPACSPRYSRFLCRACAFAVCMVAMTEVGLAQPMIPLPGSELESQEIDDQPIEFVPSDDTFVLEPQLEPIPSDDNSIGSGLKLNEPDEILGLFAPEDDERAAGGLTLGLPENVQPRVKARGSDWVGRTRFIRSHWVRLKPNGDLVGKISLLTANGGSQGARSLNVRLYRNEDLVAQTMTDDFGKFRLQNVTSGVYSLIANGDSGFVAFGLHALRSREGASQLQGSPGSKQSEVIRLAQAVEVGETLEISSAAVPPTFLQLQGILKKDFRRIRTRYVPESAYTSLIREAAKHKTCLLYTSDAADE